MTNVSGTIGSVLSAKPRQLWTVSPETTVLDAIRLMSERDIGAVLVLRGESLVGVFSERDYTRKIVLCGKSSRDTAVSEVLTEAVITIPPSATIEDAMGIMTESRVRHLPVLSAEGEVLGVVSIGDLVKWTISAQNATIDQLSTYVLGQV